MKHVLTEKNQFMFQSCSHDSSIDSSNIKKILTEGFFRK